MKYAHDPSRNKEQAAETWTIHVKAPFTGKSVILPGWPPLHAR
jgi:hypothetical protein